MMTDEPTTEIVMARPAPPMRAYTFRAELGADTLEDLIGFLRHIEYQILTGSTDVTSGGYSSGGNWHIVHDPEMTHDRYFEIVNAYLEDRGYGRR